MPPSIQASLSGTLGERHRCLNSLVRDAHQRSAPPPSPHTRTEEPPIDRLFAIDLASKQNNLEYILLTLKDDDMLYVSRALKSLWLLEPEYSDVINPKRLEEELFPQMRTQAVNKMKHWIQTHLKDAKRCEEFYKFYKDKEFETAAKFLWHCSEDYLLREFTNILNKITPKLLKVLSEKVPRVTKVYYDSLKDNQDLLKYYLQNDSKFFANIRYLLKSDADIFFHIVENFYVHSFRAFNSEITKHIMRHHKNKFMAKPEFYTAKILDVDTIAKYLTSEEIKDLVIKLAKAEYVMYWFSYQVVEPLIKRLKSKERAEFKKFVFVDKAFGPMVKDWPYPMPTPPVLTLTGQDSALFRDKPIRNQPIRHRPLRGGGGGPNTAYPGALLGKSKKKKRCDSNNRLDELFDKYRFSNYKETLVDLRKGLRAASSAQDRLYMLLVLVSKTGGRSEDLISLVDLMTQYKNEPVQIRAAVIRSLVKRASIWRLPHKPWAKLMQWGHGLGLDGGPPEVDCSEGLDAVVIRDILAGVTSSYTVWQAFLEDFSTFEEYSLTSAEKDCVRRCLPALLLASAVADPDLNKASDILHFLLDTHAEYDIYLDAFPGTIEAIASLAEKNFDAAKSLLSRLYNDGVFRDRLIKENFEMIQTDASYVNALRHDISILENTKKFEELIGQEKGPQLENFTRKLAVYFTEKNGLAERYCTVLEQRATTTPDIKLARPLALLASSNFLRLLKVCDAAKPKTSQRQLAAALRANAHVVRPAFDLESFGWRAAGAKAVANRVVTCRQTEVERYLTETLSWRRTLRLSLILAKRTDKEHEAYEDFAFERPTAALNSALRYFQREEANSDLRIWEIVKTKFPKLGKRNLEQVVKDLPKFDQGDYNRKFLADYYVTVYKTCKANLNHKAQDLMLRIPLVLPEVDEQFMLEEIDEYHRKLYLVCSDQFHRSKNTHPADNDALNQVRCSPLFSSIIVRFLMLSTSEEKLKDRLGRITPLLNFFEMALNKGTDNTGNIAMNSFLLHLRYNKAFFDDKYVCLPVFGWLTNWMQRSLTLDEWLDDYIKVHLTLTYFKTVRQCLKDNQEIFADEAQKLKEGPKILGTVFGQFIGDEIEQLSFRYFPSITELYGAEVVNYFRACLLPYDQSVQKFTAAVIIALLEGRKVNSCVLAKYVFNEYRSRMTYDVEDIIQSFEETGITELVFAIDYVL